MHHGVPDFAKFADFLNSLGKLNFLFKHTSQFFYRLGLTSNCCHTLCGFFFVLLVERKILKKKRKGIVGETSSNSLDLEIDTVWLTTMEVWMNMWGQVVQG